MDRNTVIGFVLIFLLLMGYVTYNSFQAKKLKETQKDKKEQVSPASDPGDTTSGTRVMTAADSAALIMPDSVKQAQQQVQAGAFAASLTGESKEYVLENEDIKISFSSKGGEISRVELKKYKTYDKQPLVLAQPGEVSKSFTFYQSANAQAVDTRDLFFTTSGPAAGGEKNTISFRLPAGEGYFEQKYTLAKNGYELDYEVNVVNMDNVIPKNSRSIDFTWSRNVALLERDKTTENKYTALHYKYKNDDEEHLSETKDEKKAAETSLSWISYKQQFFNSALIIKGNDGFKNVTLNSEVSGKNKYLKTFTAKAQLPYNHGKTESYKMQYYYGPNHYQTLKKMDIGLEKILSLGWFAFISKWFLIPVMNFLEQYIGNFGVIILIITLLIKVLLTPLSYKSQHSMAKMKVLKPEIDELKEKYKDDQQKFGSEQMKLMSKAGVNPLGGCIPTLLIAPVLIAMYNFFPASIELRQEAFLWATDLSTYDSIWNFPGGFKIPFYGNHVSLFTLLMTVTSILYAISNAQLSGSNTGPMKYMPYIFPVMLMGMFNSFPAALTYFYFLNNLISYAQQWLIQKFLIDEAALHKQIQENKKKTPKAGWLQKRLDDIQKQQQQAQKQPQQTTKPRKKG